MTTNPRGVRSRIRIGDVVDGHIICAKRMHPVAKRIEATAYVSPGLMVNFWALTTTPRPTMFDLPGAAMAWRRQAVECKLAARRAKKDANVALHRRRADRCERNARRIERLAEARFEPKSAASGGAK